MIVIILLLEVLQIAIFIRIALTWLIMNPNDRTLRVFTDPIDKILKPFKVVIPAGRIFLDIGPLLVLILLQVLSRVLAHM